MDDVAALIDEGNQRQESEPLFSYISITRIYRYIYSYINYMCYLRKMGESVNAYIQLAQVGLRAAFVLVCGPVFNHQRASPKIVFQWLQRGRALPLFSHTRSMPSSKRGPRGYATSPADLPTRVVRRQQACTALNAHSSRSHAILILNVTLWQGTLGGWVTLSSICLFLAFLRDKCESCFSMLRPHMTAC